MGSTSVSSPAPATSIDPKDVQGLARFGYKALKQGCYLLLRIRDAAAARSWCGTAPVATAEVQSPPPEVALHVAFTWPGLRELGLPDHALSGFSSEFRFGMSGDESRSRRLGDIGANAPSKWDWGRPGSEPDVLVMLFAAPGRLPDWRRTVENQAFEAAFEILLELPTGDLDGHEPFGFQDGISQPEIDWAGKRVTGHDELQYTNVVAAGEFLFGYPNEYAKYTDRPLLDPAEKGASGLLPAEDYPSKLDLTRNGSYLVMRQLEQDVRGFWRSLDSAANSDPSERLRLAAAMVGRTTTGNPLVPPSGAAIAGVDDPSNRFTYDSDPKGTRCPFGAHIRRANPRNADLPGNPEGLLARGLRMLGFCVDGLRGDLVASTRFHRILRRGREYGPGLSIEEAVSQKPEDNEKRGIHFLCLNANISRQFEFVQNAWLMSTKFNGLSEESDPLMGSRAPVGECHYTGDFSAPRETAPPQRLTGLPQFITVRGGAYFFLPSLRALKYFAQLPTQSR